MLSDRATPLQLTDLHLRHRGLSAALASLYAEAAAVCLSRHHEPPTCVSISVYGEGSGASDTSEALETIHDVTWAVPDARSRAAHNNKKDATEMGAYGLVLASMEARLGYVAHSRSPQGSGADFYVAPREAIVEETEDPLDLEGVIVLEVSGIDECLDDAPLRRRLRQKVRQIIRGAAGMPGIAGVAGFSCLRVLFEYT